MEDDMATAPSPEIHTYHCICTNFILATPTKLSKHPRRGGQALDKAYIVPVAAAADNAGPLTPGAGKLIGTHLGGPVITRREDGFEKRYMLKCTRCQLTVGYHLDAVQFPSAHEGESGAYLAAAYILPGGLLSTKDMAAGKDVSGAIEFEGLKREADEKR